MTSCDVFCRVIDNFGDAGFGWRLARTLCAERHWSVRLIIDCPEIVEPLCSGKHAGVEIVTWNDDFNAKTNHSPADVVLENFSCRLPETYEAAIARETIRRPIHVFAIEYLTAEPFAESNNGLPSPHPRYGYPKTYLYPGFTEKTSGLLIEKDFRERKKAFGNKKRDELLSRLGANPRAPFTLLFFTYPDFDVLSFVKALRKDGRSIQILCAQGEATNRLLDALHSIADNLVHPVLLPFLDQDTFDEVLWSVDAAIVRGEESTVRAQISGKPFLWTLYRIRTGEHQQKAEAFAKLYVPTVPICLQSIWEAMFLSLNGKRMDFSMWSAWRDAIEKKGDEIGVKWMHVLESHPTLIDAIGKRSSV